MGHSLFFVYSQHAPPLYKGTFFSSQGTNYSIIKLYSGSIYYLERRVFGDTLSIVSTSSSQQTHLTRHHSSDQINRYH